MKKLICKIVLVIDILLYIALSGCALFIRQYDFEAGIVSDGFGRILSEAPFIFRQQGLMEYWAGSKWFALDSTVSFVLLIFGLVLFEYIRNDK